VSIANYFSTERVSLAQPSKQHPLGLLPREANEKWRGINSRGREPVITARPTGKKNPGTAVRMRKTSGRLPSWSAL